MKSELEYKLPSGKTVNLWVDLVIVTPKLAAEWLKHNIGNRPIRPLQLKYFMSLMNLGQWGTVPDSIAFDEDGNLFNGQTRLTACVNTNTSFISIVSGGYERDSTIPNTDTGWKRTVSDNAELPKGITSMISQAFGVYGWFLPGCRTRVANTVPFVRAFYEKYQEECDLVASWFKRPKQGMVHAVTKAVFLRALISTGRYSELHMLADAIYNPVDHSEYACGNNADKLRDALLGEHNVTAKYYKVESYVASSLRGRRRKKINRADTEQFPIEIPAGFDRKEI